MRSTTNEYGGGSVPVNLPKIGFFTKLFEKITGGKKITDMAHLKIRRLAAGLLVILPICLYAGGETETERMVRKLKDEYNITAYPIIEHEFYDYVVTAHNTVILFMEGPKIIEHNLATGEKTELPLPPEWQSHTVGRITAYCEEENSVHMTTSRVVDGPLDSQSRSIEAYYIFHLADYTWERVPELDDLVLFKYYYSPSAGCLYFKVVAKDMVLVFDMKERVFREPLVYDGEKYRYLFTMYGDPLQLLFSVRRDNDDRSYYGIFDTGTNTGTTFSAPPVSTDMIAVGTYYSPIDRLRFLGINDKFASRGTLIELDLAKGIYRSVGMDNFIHPVSFLKRAYNGQYSFFVLAKKKHRLGNRYWRYLCFLDYR